MFLGWGSVEKLRKLFKCKKHDTVWHNLAVVSIQDCQLVNSILLLDQVRKKHK